MGEVEHRNFVSSKSVSGGTLLPFSALKNEMGPLENTVIPLLSPPSPSQIRPLPLISPSFQGKKANKPSSL